MWTAVVTTARISSKPSERIDREIVVRSVWGNRAGEWQQHPPARSTIPRAECRERRGKTLARRKIHRQLGKM
jgi:hypothetical protein